MGPKLYQYPMLGLSLELVKRKLFLILWEFPEPREIIIVVAIRMRGPHSKSWEWPRDFTSSTLQDLCSFRELHNRGRGSKKTTSYKLKGPRHATPPNSSEWATFKRCLRVGRTRPRRHYLVDWPFWKLEGSIDFRTTLRSVLKPFKRSRRILIFFCIQEGSLIGPETKAQIDTMNIEAHESKCQFRELIDEESHQLRTNDLIRRLKPQLPNDDRWRSDGGIPNMKERKSHEPDQPQAGCSFRRRAEPNDCLRMAGDAHSAPRGESDEIDFWSGNRMENEDIYGMTVTQHLPDDVSYMKWAFQSASSALQETWTRSDTFGTIRDPSSSGPEVI